jgi:YegS/Rv2252/BmrU family lipid kinase
MLDSLTIIVNPIAGSGKGIRYIEQLKYVLSRNRIEPDIKPTRQTGDAIEIARNYSQNHPIICLGGDGTFNEIINGILLNTRFSPGNRPLLGLIPFGSGNVIAKELKLKRNPQHFVNLYQNNLVRTLDIGCVRFINPEGRSRYFVSMLGIGFDAEVARQYQSNRKGAKLQAHLLSYFPLALKTIYYYQMPSIAIQIDDKTISNDASFVQIANVRSYGGPFVLVNEAIPDDGLLDVSFFKSKSSLNILLYYTFAFFGKANLLRQGKQTAKKITLHSENKVPVQIDGDFCGELPVEVEIIPEAVRIFSPSSLEG